MGAQADSAYGELRYDQRSFASSGSDGLNTLVGAGASRHQNKRPVTALLLIVQMFTLC